MKRLVSAAFVLVLCTGVLAANPARSEQGETPAQSLHHFLLNRGLLKQPTRFRFGRELEQLYSLGSVPKPKGCPLTRFIDQPDTASRDAVNFFTARFTKDPRLVCTDAPNPGSCLAIQDSCITIGTSIFCDDAYLTRRAMIGALAYYNAWRGLRRVSAGEPARFYPLSPDALIDLARMTISLRQHQAYPPKRELSVVPKAVAMASAGKSSVSHLAVRIALLAPLLHEVAHVEQAHCGRSVDTEPEQRDPDEGGNLFQWAESLRFQAILGQRRDYDLSSRVYAELTCARLSRTELDAELRGIFMLLAYLREKGPPAVKNPWFEFAPDLTDSVRAELRALVRWSYEIALLSLMHTTEYDLLLYQHPEKGLALIRGEPEITARRAYADYYLAGGNDASISRVRGHLEPAFRALESMTTLKTSRLALVNRGNSTALAHVRLAPFTKGRIDALRKDNCPLERNDHAKQIIARYVDDAYSGYPGTKQSNGRGPGNLAEAQRVLARFVEPGADHKVLTRALEPSLDDFRTIFEQPFADQAHAAYGPYWERAQVLISMEANQVEVLVYSASSDELRADGVSGDLPGGYRKIAKSMRPGLTIYRWRYVAPGETTGWAYDGLYYVNGHWVFIPKPWYVLDRLSSKDQQ